MVVMSGVTYLHILIPAELAFCFARRVIVTGIKQRSSRHLMQFELWLLPAVELLTALVAGAVPLVLAVCFPDPAAAAGEQLKLL